MPHDSQQAPAAGWFADPHDPTLWRWWNGVAWTKNVHPMQASPEAAAPAPALTAVPPQSAAVEAEPAQLAPLVHSAGEQDGPRTVRDFDLLGLSERETTYHGNGFYTQREESFFGPDEHSIGIDLGWVLRKLIARFRRR